MMDAKQFNRSTNVMTFGIVCAFVCIGPVSQCY